MFIIKEIIEATGGTLVSGKLSQAVSGVSTDTRQIRRNQVFVAIKGDNFDGHDFLVEAAGKGATVLVVSCTDVPVPPGVALVCVKDTVKALGSIARYHRRRFNIPVIAITGSAGKTSTKELVAAVMRKKYRVLFNKGTENNHIGVPMTLLKLTRRHEVAVIEMGTNHPGEIAWLAGIALPTIAVFTNVGPSHLEGLGTLQGVYREKSDLLKYLPPDGHVVVNGDDPFWSRLLNKRLPQRVLSYGIDVKADVRPGALTSGVTGLSRGGLQNALAAIACARILRVAADKVKDAIKRSKPAKGRQCFVKVGGVTVIDDTYNANPLSYRNALGTLKVLPCAGRRVLVAADMLELGSASDELHRQVGHEAAQAGIDAVFTYGKRARLIGGAAKQKRPSLEVRHFNDHSKLVAALEGYLCRGDIFLCKGSRGMRMEKVVQQIVAFLKG